MKIIDILKKYRHSVLIFADILIVICSYITAILFLDLKINSIIDLIKELCMAVLVYEIYLNILQMYKNMIRYEIGKDYVKYMFIGLISTLSLIIISRLLKLEYLGIRINVLAGIFISGAFVLYRLAGRSIMSRRSARINKKNKKDTNSENKPQNLLIIGAGMGAREIIIAIKNSMKDKYNIVGIVDDNTNKLNKSILGIKVLGTRYDIPEIVKEKEVNIIFLAINKVTQMSRKKIIEICQTTGVKTRVLPSTEDIIEKQGVMNSLRDVEIEDLLGRDVIELDNKNISSLIKDNTVLVTGGGGSIGSELCRQIIKYNPERLVILDIYENNLYDIELELKANYPKAKIDAIVGSVRDKKKIRRCIFKIQATISIPCSST